MVERKIVIVGFMASGKSRVARELSFILERPFVDLDEVITRNGGRTPREIIEQDGEASFRALETLALEKVLTRNDVQVVAVGGGAWAVERNREMIKSHGGFTVWLDVPFENCWRRIEAGSERRPLAPSRETAVRLFESRRPSYALADTRIVVSEKENPHAIAAKIAAVLQKA